MSSDFRRGFDALRLSRDLHPEEQTASATFEAAAETARQVSADCLPLGIAVVMHLYPLCTLRCVPLPWWSTAGRRRARLLRAVDLKSLILANAGSERVAGVAAQAPMTLTRTSEGIRASGTFDYVSLAHVADIVLFSAPFERGDLFCAADMRGGTVRIGASRFTGSMALSDTCSVTFEDHPIRADRCIRIPTESALQCMAKYQRSWFQLLLADAYLSRIGRLHRQWKLPRPVDELASMNEVEQLREYAMALLDTAASPAAIETLAGVAAAIKLRVSLLAQATAAAVKPFDESAAHELGFLRRQPTSDDQILASIRAQGTLGCQKNGNPVSRRSRKVTISDSHPLDVPV
jgi:alkylation response protein AidB-like acyl-CoA dehydrogenase